jgi:hypothetical protein
MASKIFTFGDPSKPKPSRVRYLRYDLIQSVDRNSMYQNTVAHFLGGSTLEFTQTDQEFDAFFDSWRDAVDGSQAVAVGQG